jgi:hypothetical protein
LADLQGTIYTERILRAKTGVVAESDQIAGALSEHVRLIMIFTNSSQKSPYKLKAN